MFNPPAPIDLKRYIREVPDFPKPGILFYDISSLLGDADGWAVALERLSRATMACAPELLAGVESRGFLLSAPLAGRLGLGFTMLRKPGKLPGETISLSYGLEYGTDALHLQKGAVKPGQRVVVLDDLLATGGTLEASIKLLGQAGAKVVGAVVMIELEGLGGRARIEGLGIPLTSLVTYQEA
ncbi:adenine phosphoribosyltransferase [Formicincola oecophyllae]|uniref:Adenine phosphoribosyltransferase n=1 Tax=Formicincola oecophyllae TaxID=2558361 RepID=A0A4Y6U8I5_9PROT|nr:adenine phosphoribosyltransferase [Formicincola oecophyllae]QDH13300.1 adenine phosphoribosyltransferase [Formicincola oecophyllae]